MFFFFILMQIIPNEDFMWTVTYFDLVCICVTASIQHGRFTAVWHMQINQNILWLIKDVDLSSE